MSPISAAAGLVLHARDWRRSRARPTSSLPGHWPASASKNKRPRWRPKPRPRPSITNPEQQAQAARRWWPACWPARAGRRDGNPGRDRGPLHHQPEPVGAGADCGDRGTGGEGIWNKHVTWLPWRVAVVRWTMLLGPVSLKLKPSAIRLLTDLQLHEATM